jgi:hypothetical protein
MSVAHSPLAISSDENGRQDGKLALDDVNASPSLTATEDRLQSLFPNISSHFLPGTCLICSTSMASACSKLSIVRSLLIGRMGPKSKAKTESDANLISQGAPADELTANCPDLEQWPRSWMYEERDLPHGQQMVECFVFVSSGEFRLVAQNPAIAPR